MQIDLHCKSSRGKYILSNVILKNVVWDSIKSQTVYITKQIIPHSHSDTLVSHNFHQENRQNLDKKFKKKGGNSYQKIEEVSGWKAQIN